jgi:hypothetical protein
MTSDSADVGTSTVSVQALLENAKRLGLIWSLRPGTVQLQIDDAVQVILDGDVDPIGAISLIGFPVFGARVMAMLVPPGGVFIIGNIGVGSLVGTCIARGFRGTTSTASATEQSVLRIDDIPMKSGRLYFITSGPLTLDVSVANDVARALLRLEDTGVATTASTLLRVADSGVINITSGNSVIVSCHYTPATDITASILLSTSRIQGTGVVSITAGGGVPTNLYVFDCGDDPGDTGVIL